MREVPSTRFSSCSEPISASRSRDKVAAEDLQRTRRAVRAAIHNRASLRKDRHASNFARRRPLRPGQRQPAEQTPASREDATMATVELAIYDLTMGMAKQMAAPLAGLLDGKSRRDGPAYRA